MPATGLYGLVDLIGLDVMGLVASNLAENLPEDDKTTVHIDESQINAAIFVESVEITRSLVASVGSCERIKATPSKCGANDA